MFIDLKILPTVTKWVRASDIKCVEDNYMGGSDVTCYYHDQNSGSCIRALDKADVVAAKLNAHSRGGYILEVDDDPPTRQH